MIETHGFEVAYFIKGVMMLLICLPAIFYPFSLRPEADGLLPYGHDEDELKKETPIKNKTQFNFFTLGFSCFFIFAIFLNTLTGLTQHFSGFTESIGYGASMGAMLISASMIGNIFSKLVFGILSDALGAVKATMIMMAINGLGIILLLCGFNFRLLVIGSFLFGSIYSVCAVGVALLTKHFFGSKNYTSVFAMVSFGTNFGAAFALSLVGYLYDFTGAYTSAFMIALSIQVINAILLWIVIKQSQKTVKFQRKVSFQK